LDIGGILVGVVRGPELYGEADEYSNLKPGDEVEATVVDLENEKGELELSFRIAGQEKAWDTLREAYKKRQTVKVRVIDGNKGGVLVRFRQISGFLAGFTIGSGKLSSRFRRRQIQDFGKIKIFCRHGYGMQS
jgi:small subunit ribosomal protein S1